MSASQYQSSNKNDLCQLVDLIESSDSNVSDEVAVILREVLSNGDTNCLFYLLEKFVLVDSERILDVICSIREPLDKILLDKMIDFVRTAPQRCLSIFAQLILKQPTWLYKLPGHPFLGHFLKHLKVCENVSLAVGGLFCVSCLLPLLPSMSVYLNDYFTVFISLVELLKNKSEWPEVYQIHLRIALFVFFQRLYALYPCNFLRFLRISFAGPNNYSSERKILFDSYVRPMLDQVRLHPLLIISSKDEELAKERWMHKESHDILVECNVIGINSGENGIGSGFQMRPTSASFSTHSSQQPSLSVSQQVTPMKFAIEECKPRSPLTLTPALLPSESSNLESESMNTPDQELRMTEGRSDEWSPSVAVGLCTPPSSRSDTPLSLALSDSSSLLRSSRTNSFGIDMRRKKQQENKTRKSFGQALGRFFNKPDANRRAQLKTSSVPPSPMLKDDNKNEFTFPVVGPSLSQRRTIIGRENSAELAEEANENEVLVESSVTNVVPGETMTIVAEIAKCLSVEDSRQEDVEVGILTQLHNDGCERVDKSRHSSSRSSQSRNISRHSSFLDAPLTFNCSDSDRLPNNSFCAQSNDDGTVAESEPVPNLPFFIGSEPVPAAIPRLSNSHSVADFMKRMNRLRFHSQCTTGVLTSDGNSADNAPMVENSEQFIEPQTIKLQPKRPRSCPVKTDFSIADSSSTPLKTPVDMSRRESNQGPPVTNSLDNQKSFTTNRSPTEERSFTLDNVCSFDFPLLKLAKMFYPVVESYKIKDISSTEHVATVNVYENFDDYLLISRLSHDCDIVQKIDKASSGKMELEQLRTAIALLRHQLFYERHKRILHAERNRRLYGRLKQTSALEEQNQAQKDQLRLQEIEIQQLVQALSDSRRGNVEAKNDFVDKESVLTNRLQTVLKERNEFATKLELKLHELSSVMEKNHLLFKELSSCKQHLFNATSQLEIFIKENEKPSSSSTLSSDMLTREALLVAEINNRLRSKLKVYQEYETSLTFLQDKLKDYESSAKKETNELKRTLRKEKNRADASTNKLTELEGQLHKRHQQIGESKRQLDEAREVHQEHLKALQMKFRSLVSVCQRQEAHILELYQQLEQNNVRDIYNASRASFAGSVEAKNSLAGARVGSFCEGVRIPSRQGAKELMSYDSDVYAGLGSSCGSENMFLPFLFERRSVPQRTTSNVEEVEDEVVYAS